MNINIPDRAQSAGIPGQGSVDITSAELALITGSEPAVLTVDNLLFEQSQTIPALTPVGHNGAGRLVPANDDYSAGAKASDLLTFSGVGTANDTITVDTKVYTLVAAPTTVDGQVKIGATADDTANNFLAAINGGAGAGTLYGSLTVEHPTVSARKNASAVVEVVAKTAGTAGNAIAATESGTGTSFATATLAGGKDQIGAKAIGITITDVVSPAGTAYIGAGVYRGGCFNPDKLNWPAAFNTDAKKFAAFEGAPSPTNIIIRRPKTHKI